MKHIIAFGHRSRVGKDSAAKIAERIIRLEYQGITVQRVGFADKLKSICFQLFGQYGMKDGQHYEDHPEDRHVKLSCGKTPIEILIEVGESMKKTCPTIWVDHVLNNCRTQVLLISDLRFPIEVEAVKKLGGKIVKVERNVPKLDTVADNALEGFKDWDYIIHNDESLDYLYTSCGYIVKRVLAQ